MQAIWDIEVSDVDRPEVAVPAQAILNAIPSPVIVLDGELRLLRVNAAAETLFGMGRSVLEGRPLSEFLVYDSSCFDLVRRVQTGASSVSDYGVGFPLLRGVLRQVDLHLAPLAEVPGGTVVVIHPCSVAQSLNRQIDRRGGARSIAGLAATLAHEVKNPLSGIRGAAQLLEASVDEEERPLLRLICDETDRICSLVDRMEEFADGQPMQREAVNIYQVLEHVRRLAEHGFARSITFVERFDPSLPEVDGDRDGLVQVFLNLIKNAAEAAPHEGGEIRITTQYEHGLRIRVAHSRERVELPILIQIQDNGPGISDEIHSHLFEPFVSTKSGSRGLGLALVAKIVGDHGGLIEVQNGDRGAVFKVRLPAHRGSGAMAI